MHHDLDTTTNKAKRATNLPPQKLVLFTLGLLFTLLSLLGLAAGFMYGESYGRKHAQYDNPSLREYYAGQCYSYWDKNVQKTLRLALEKTAAADQETARLDELRLMLQDLQRDVSEMALHKNSTKNNRKKVISASLLP